MMASRSRRAGCGRRARREGPSGEAVIRSAKVVEEGKEFREVLDVERLGNTLSAATGRRIVDAKVADVERCSSGAGREARLCRWGRYLGLRW